MPKFHRVSVLEKEHCNIKRKSQLTVPLNVIFPDDFYLLVQFICDFHKVALVSRWKNYIH